MESNSNNFNNNSTETITIQENQQEKKILVLKLREKCVQWDENVVNNEFMGKKSSKRCCIFHRKKHFRESDSDESDSDVEEAEKKADSSIPAYLRHHA